MRSNELTTRPGEVLPLVPLRDMVVFPHMMAPFVVGRDSSIRALEAALSTPSKRLFLSAQKDPQLDEPQPGDIHSVGVVATVAQSLKLPNGHIKVMVEGVRRGRIAGFEERPGYLGVAVEWSLLRILQVRPTALSSARETLTPEVRGPQWNFSIIQPPVKASFSTRAVRVTEGMGV